MSTLAIHYNPAAINVTFHEACVSFALADGRTVAAPLTWFPRLQHATASQRNNWEKIGQGHGIHWKDIDEDISILALLGVPD